MFQMPWKIKAGFVGMSDSFSTNQDVHVQCDAPSGQLLLMRWAEADYGNNRIIRPVLFP